MIGVLTDRDKFKEKIGNNHINFKMKIIFIFIFYFLCLSTQAQSFYVDSIRNKIEFLKSIYPYQNSSNKELLDLLWNDAASKLDSIYFYSDSNLIKYIIDNSDFISKQRDSNKIIGIQGSDLFKYNYSNYLNSLRYIGLNSIEYYNSIINNEDRYFLFIEIDKRNKVSFDYIYSGLDDSLVHKLLKLVCNYNEYNSFIGAKSFLKYRNEILLDSLLYVKFLFSLSMIKSNFTDSIYNSELLWYSTSSNKPWNIDESINSIMNNTFLTGLFKENEIQYSIINAEKEVIRNKHMSRQDSIFNLISQVKMDTNISRIILERRFDPKWIDLGEDIVQFVNLDSMSISERHKFEVGSDTTLWNPINDIYLYLPNEADDGFRADILSNSELLELLSGLNFYQIYDSLSLVEYGDQPTKRIQLRKIFQILGDRCAYGLFVPGSSQRQLLDQWIDDYYSMACNDTLLDKKSEAGEQLIKLWRLLYPKFKDWIRIDNKCRYGMMCVLSQLTNMVTESMVVDLIADGDQALANGDTARVETLGYFLARVWRDVDIPENQRMQRRPVRTAVETQQWVDAYIYPALIRWNHPASWK